MIFFYADFFFKWIFFLSFLCVLTGCCSLIGSSNLDFGRRELRMPPRKFFLPRPPEETEEGEAGGETECRRSLQTWGYIMLFNNNMYLMLFIMLFNNNMYLMLFIMLFNNNMLCYLYMLCNLLCYSIITCYVIYCYLIIITGYVIQLHSK